MRILLCFSVCFLSAVSVCGQAAVEHSAITGAGATAASAGSKGAGQSIGGVFRSLSGTLEKAGSAPVAAAKAPTAAPGVKTASTARPVPSKQPTEPPAPATKPIDPALVTEGLDRAELIERFGEPVLQMSETKNSQLVERLWYNATRSNQVEIRLIDGKVASVRPPASNKQ